MTSLIELRVSDNGLTSPPESIGNLSRLRELHLRNNKLTGLPEVIATLPRLEKLDLRWVDTLAYPAWVTSLEARGCAVYL